MIERFSIFKASTKIFFASLADETGTAIDLTNQTAMKIRAIDALSGAMKFDLDLSLDGAATEGKIQRNFEPADTQNISSGEFLGQIKITFSSGAIYKSPLFYVDILQGV